MIASPSSTMVPLTFSNHPSYAFPIYDFAQFNTPQDIRRVFLDGALKGILEYVNQAIANLITTGNFNSYTAIAGGTAGLFTIADMANAWGQLAAAKVPVRDFGNFFVMTHPVPFSGMVRDTTWSANSQVGYQIAGETRRYAMLGEQWGALVDYDVAMPTTTSGSPPVTTYKTLIFHRHAIALAVRDIPVPDTPVVMGTILLLKGLLPVRVMLGYSQLKGAWITTVDCGYALAIIRPDHGIIATC